MLLYWLFLLMFATSAAMANGLDQNLLTFVQTAIPKGGIVFRGEVQSNRTAYELFVLQQETRRGVLVITGGSGDPPAKPLQVLFADTSFDFALPLIVFFFSSLWLFWEACVARIVRRFTVTLREKL